MLVRDIEVEVEGRDDKEAICSRAAHHSRSRGFVVDVAKTRQRLRQKRAA